MTGKLPTQASTIRVRSEFTNLIDVREIFCSNGVKDISCQAALLPGSDGESKTSHSRWAPFGACSEKMALRSGQSQRQRPVAWQVKQRHFIKRQNARGAVPIPVLAIHNFQAMDEW